MEQINDMQRRLDDIEIKLSFTEDLVEQLNLTVFQQSQQIDALVQLVQQLRQQVPEQTPGQQRNLRDEIPPHY